MKRRAGRSDAPTLPSLADAPQAVRRQTRDGQTAVIRAEWVDPDDVRPNAVRKPRQVSGYRSYCPLRRMFRLQGSQITDRHIYAADRLRAAVDLAAIGVSRPQTLMPGGLTTYGPVASPSSASLRQARAGAEVKRAIARFTEAQCALLDAIVLKNRSLQTWCRSAPGRTPGIEMGKLICILDILTDHYASKIGYDLAHGRVLAV